MFLPGYCTSNYLTLRNDFNFTMKYKICKHYWATSGVGTGVALSVITGVLTFCVGTVIGLGATAAATGVVAPNAGVGAAVGTSMIANHFG